MNTKVLILHEYFAPSYKAGGIVKSLLNLVKGFGSEFNFFIISTNCDLNESQPLAGVISDQWIDFEAEAKIYYFSKQQLTYALLTKQIDHIKPDVIYINGLYSVYFVLFPLLYLKFLQNRPSVVLAPRGMLQAGALAIKPKKKHLYLALFKLTGLSKFITWHATDEQERKDTRRIFGESARVISAVDTPDLEMHPVNFINKKKGKLKLVTISLITAKKNVLAVLKALKALENEIEVEYDLYGPVKDQSYWQLCQQQIKLFNANIRVTYKGDVHPSQVNETLQQYHFFILPSLGENFGHAIYESLNAGRPVVISNLTPWKNLQAKKAGWNIDIDDPKALSKVIKACYCMEQADFDELCRGAQQAAENFITELDFISQYKQLFNTYPHRI